VNLVDTGPLVALFDKGQNAENRRCVTTYRQIGNPLSTILPCFTEAMYFLLKLNGWPVQQALWQLWERGCLRIHEAHPTEFERMKILMERYRDTPMDLADASLVSAAERLGLRRIFTLDSDFYIYRINDKDAFEVIP
jgi:uncharacterized protein